MQLGRLLLLHSAAEDMLLGGLPSALKRAV